MLDRKLRIMMLATGSDAPPDSDIRICEEARALGRLGHQVRIVTTRSAFGMPDLQIERIEPAPLSGPLPGPLLWCRPYLDQLVTGRALKAARTFRPHLIHAHHHSGAMIGAHLKKKLGLPLLFDFQFSMSDELVESGSLIAGSVVHRLLSRQERLIDAAPADCIVSGTAALARELVARWCVARSSVSLVPDGVNTTLFRAHPREETRARLSIPPELPLVVYYGPLDHRQGLNTLLSAIAQLKSTDSPLRFLIVGGNDGPWRTRVRDLGIERMVIFTGGTEYARVPYYLSAADMAVFPRTLTGGSNASLLACLACGLPTVAFDMPENRELLKEAAIYADFDDCGDLASRLTRLMGDSGERSRLAALGPQLADARHTWDIRVKVLDDIYRQKLGR